MNRKEIYKRLTEIFQEVFDRKDIILNDETNAGDIKGFDSLAYITIISTVEDEFSVRLPMKQVLSLQKTGELVDLIEERVSVPGPGH